MMEEDGTADGIIGKERRKEVSGFWLQLLPLPATSPPAMNK